jgi:hypothetical protein
MPYIHPDDRRHYESALNLMVNRLSQRSFEAGHLTYIIYSLLIAKLRFHPKAGYFYKSLTRASATDASDEFYRRVMATHEDRAIEDNGDIRVIQKSQE